MISSRLALVVAWLCAAPFVFLNFLAVNQVSSFLALVRPGGETISIEQLILLGSLLLTMFGGVIALSPSWSGSKAQRVPLVNIVSAVILISAATILIISLGLEAYRCDFLNVPNCG